MIKPITSRLRNASADNRGMCTLPAGDIVAALKAITCLKDLTCQIRAGRLTDELGHEFQLNDAYMGAVELLAQIEGDSGKP